MSDNTQINLATTDGDFIATKDVGGVKYERIILTYDVGGTPIDVTDAAGLPVNVLTGGLTSIQPGSSALELGKREDAAHADGDVGVMGLAVRNDSDASLCGTTLDYTPLQVDASGFLKVNIKAGASSGAVVDASTFTRGSSSGVPAVGVVETSAPTLTNGKAGTLSLTTGGALRVDVSSGSITAVTDDAAVTPATTQVLMAGFTADESSTDSIDEGDGGMARMTLDRKQIVAEYVHAAAGGASSYSALSAAAVLTAEIKSSAGKVYSLQVFNLNAAARYVRLYNQTGAPASTDGANIVWRGIIPGATTGAGFVVQFPKGKQFTTGIGIRASAAVADNDTTALAANELAFNVDYA